MHAIAISRFGGPEVLQVVDLDRPNPGPGEVLIRVRAAGVNRPDIVQREGRYPPPPGAPETPGLEVAGSINMVGAGVEGWDVGDEVCALVAGGGYAEYCLAPAETLLPVPKGFSFTEAAALPETFFTVWSNVFDRAYLDAGETLLVHGGTSGIGTTAIQLAKAFGARVFTTAGSQDKCTFCHELGADLALNYRTDDWQKEVLAASDGKGVNVVLDMVGGDYVAKNLACLAQDGRLVQIAFLRGPVVGELNLLPVMLKRLTVTGSTLRPRDNAFKGAIAQSLADMVWPLLDAGTIKPVIDSTFPLADAAGAHARMESGVHMGKIILEIAH
ncbi:MAG: NAD(P)H-quinone oxidoreductase [Sphingomonadales bacterium]|nr:NAD(P)H-quinone oxidoreductase [Sphingomonadales bacterium]